MHGGLNRVYIRAEKDELLAIPDFLPLYLPFDSFSGVFQAAVFMTVRDNYKHHFFSAVIVSRVLLGIANFVNRPADRVKKRG